MKRILSAITLLAAAPLATSQNIYDTKGGFGIGVFFPSLDTSVRVDNNESDLGTGISLEGDLTFEKDESVFRANAFWRPAQKHRLFIDYYDIKRDVTRTLQGDITVDDTVFPVDTTVRADFNTRIIPIFYEYSIYQTPRTEVGIGGGVHWLDLELGISATNSSLAEVAEVSGPLPLIGVSMDHLFTDQWMFYGSVQAFSANVNDIDGKILAARIGVEYLFTEQFSVGLGWDFFDLDVDLTDNDWTGNVNFDYNGANLRFQLRF